jgi:hypothetical protein
LLDLTGHAGLFSLRLSLDCVDELYLYTFLDVVISQVAFRFDCSMLWYKCVAPNHQSWCGHYGCLKVATDVYNIHNSQLNTNWSLSVILRNIAVKFRDNSCGGCNKINKVLNFTHFIIIITIYCIKYIFSLFVNKLNIFYVCITND